MRRVIRAFQIEYKNCGKRRRPADRPLRLETVASVFGNSARTVGEAAGRLQLSEQAAKSYVIKEGIG